MSSILKWVSHTFVVASFIVSGIISISISSWQYQNHEGGLYVIGKSWNSVCKDFPYEYVRPFSISCSNCGDKSASYCGYSESNTGFRLCVAIVTFAFGFVVLFKLLDSNPVASQVAFALNAVLWFSVFIVDCTTLANATSACSDNSFFSGVSFDCNNESYGITIAVDVCVTIITFLAWYVMSYTHVEEGSESLANKV